MRYLKPKAWNFQNGFTLVELLVVVALVTVIGITSVPFYSRFFTQNAVGNTYDQLLSQLRKAQTYAMVGKQNGPWGAHYQSSSPKSIILFQGASFATRNTAFDEKFTVNPNVSVAGFTDIIFSKITGAPNTSAAITITGNNTTKTITVAGQGIANPANTPAVLPTLTPIPGMAGYWKFDDGSPSLTAADSSGNANTGTLNGPAWTTGKLSQAIDFDGSNDFVNIGNPSNLWLTSSATWTAWVKLGALPLAPGDRAIITKYASSNEGWNFDSSADVSACAFRIEVASNGSTSANRYGATVCATGLWYFVAGVYNASAQTLDIYLNGVLDNGTLQGTVPSSQFNSANNVNIGRTPSNKDHFDGIIDDVRIYNSALSASEIQALYNGAP